MYAAWQKKNKHLWQNGAIIFVAQNMKNQIQTICKAIKPITCINTFNFMHGDNFCFPHPVVLNDNNIDPNSFGIVLLTVGNVFYKRDFCIGTINDDINQIYTESIETPPRRRGGASAVRFARLCL